MRPSLSAYMPLATYPQAATDLAILAAEKFGASLGYALDVRAYAIDFPRSSSALGNILLDLPGLARSADEKSVAECDRLKRLVLGAAESPVEVKFATSTVVLGGAPDAAAIQARYYDLVLLPWSGESSAALDMAQALIFGSGRPCILVPSSAAPAKLDHIAVAWDGSRVAARALHDVLPMMTKQGCVTILTVIDEKSLGKPNIGSDLARVLAEKGYEARAIEINLGNQPIADALQEAALTDGAQLLAMGGFGHSRMRDFVLGGATKGVLDSARLPVLIAH